MARRMKKEKTVRKSKHELLKMSKDEQLNYYICNNILRFEDKSGKLKTSKLYVMSDAFRYENITTKQNERVVTKVEYPVYSIIDSELICEDLLTMELNNTDYYIFKKDGDVLSLDENESIKRFKASKEELKIRKLIKQLKNELSSFYVFKDEDCLVDEGEFTFGYEKMDDLYTIISNYKNLVSICDNSDLNFDELMLEDSHGEITNAFINAVINVLSGEGYQGSLKEEYFNLLINIAKNDLT